MSTTAVYSEPVTKPQLSYINDLLNEREIENVAELKDQAKELTKHTASRWITRLKQLPKRHASMVPQRGATPSVKSKVPSGRYAITGTDGTTDFYKVDRPTAGRWAGYTFVKLQVSDEYQRVPLRNQQGILDRIEADGPEQASKRYGKELGHCGVCGRTLTNNDSIERGIGPICAGKMEWTF